MEEVGEPLIGYTSRSALRTPGTLSIVGTGRVKGKKSDQPDSDDRPDDDDHSGYI